MECLAAFVLLIVLPLAAAALAVGWRAHHLARRAAAPIAELAELRRRVSALEREAHPEPAAAAPVEAAASARPEPLPTVPAVGAAAPAPPTTPPAGSLWPPAPAPPGPPVTTPAAAGPAARPTTPPPSPSVSLEERLGARLSVWIGAVALILAAGMLVKISFDRGWIGPLVRVTLGTLFGIGLLGGGEWLRRSADRVAQGLTAAGIAVLFVVQWAALELYQLISPGTAFALLALTTATAVALSLRHGVMVATLGLVGGFLTPALVSAEQPDARALFAYLFLLEGGLLVVSRRRGWGALAALNLAAALVWAIAWSLGARAEADAPWIGAFLIASLAAFLAATRGNEGWAGRAPVWLQGAAAAGLLIAAAVLANAAHFSLLTWGYVGLLAAACLLVARFRPAMEGLAWLAAATCCVLLGDWGFGLSPADANRFLSVAAALLLLLAGGAWALRAGASRPGRFAALAAAAAIAIDLLAFAAAAELDRALPWGWIQLGLAAAWVALALPEARRRTTAAEAEESLAAAAVAATTLVSLAVPMELERQWISVAWALEASALVWLAGRLRVKVLSRLAAVVAALVAARLLLNPQLLDYPTGSHPLLSWLLYGYGIPVAAFAVAAAWARRQLRPRLGTGFGIGAVTLAVMWLALSVRQAFHPGDLEALVVHLAEWGALTTAWLTLGCGLLWSARRRALVELRWGGAAVVTLAAVQALLTQSLVWNPTWDHLAVGEWPLLDALLLAFGVPALLLLVAARSERELGGVWTGSLLLRRAWGATALVLLFLHVTLEVRHLFRGPFLDQGSASPGERYAYSAAWVALATILLIAGIALRRRALRLASLPVMLLAVGKVFVWDTAHLSDLYRVLSLLGLGGSLLLLAWVYQRFVFRPGATVASS